MKQRGERREDAMLLAFNVEERAMSQEMLVVSTN